MLGLIIFAFLLSLFLPVKAIFYFLYLMAGLAVLSMAWARENKKKLAIRRHLASEEVFLGERFAVELEVSNGSLFPIPWLQVKDSFPWGLGRQLGYSDVFYLPSRGRHTLRYTLVGMRRGCYPLGPWRAFSSDTFGLAPWHVEEEDQPWVTVYPRIVPIESLGLPAKQPFGTVRTNLRVYEDPSRMVGLRDYHAGDSYRSICWKTTARAGKLMVKLYQPSISLGTMIILDLGKLNYRRPEETAIEKAIVVAASLAWHLTGLKQEVGLAVSGRTRYQEGLFLSLGKGDAHLRQILRALATAQSWDGPPFSSYIAESLLAADLRLPWGTTLVAITSFPDEESLLLLEDLYRRGYNVVILAVQADRAKEAVPAAGLPTGIRLYPISREEEMAPGIY